MPKKLKQLEIQEISFVNKGASGDEKHAARIVFLKGQKPMPSMFDRLKGVFSKEDEAAAPRTKEMMLQEIMEALPDDGMRDKLMLLLDALSQAQPAPAPEPEPVEQAMDEEELEKVAKADPALAESMRKLLDASKAQAAELAELRKAREAEKAERRREKLVEQVSKFSWLPGDHKKVAKLLEAVEDHLEDEHQETLASLFRVTDGIVKKAQAADDSLFEEVGTGRASEDSNGDDGSAEAKLEALAKNYAKDNKVSLVKARATIMKENKELRRQLGQASHARVSLGQ